MNKLVVGGIVALVVIGGVSAYMLVSSQSSGTQPSGTSNSTVSFSACDILTEDIAKSLLGSNISSPDDGSGTASTADISVTNCSYATKISAADAAKSSVPKSSGVSVLARIAKTQAGANSNQQLFSTFPAGTQEVQGLGDKAFYAPDFRLLNILKGDNWYVVTYYIDTVTNASLDNNKKLAEKLNFR